jgi:predicted alpha/beta superfamily hydrolase
MLTEQGPLTIEGSEVFELKSAVIGDTLQITVAAPHLYDSFQYPLPTLYVLDGNLCLAMASSIARTLQFVAFGAVAPVLCVGIGYSADPLEVMSLRMRDLTPTTAELPPSPMKTDKHGMGGADRFLESLVGEVFPVIEDRFRSDPADRTLVGWSLGGLFALHTLFTRPQTFAKYVPISPSIWWNDRTVSTSEEAYAVSHQDLSAKVFACVGEREETAPARMWPPITGDGAQERIEFSQTARMVSNLDELVSRLRSRGYPNLDLTHEVFLDEHHSTVFPAAFTRALVALHAT